MTILMPLMLIFTLNHTITNHGHFIGRFKFVMEVHSTNNGINSQSLLTPKKATLKKKITKRSRKNTIKN